MIMFCFLILFLLWFFFCFFNFYMTLFVILCEVIIVCRLELNSTSFCGLEECGFLVGKYGKNLKDTNLFNLNFECEKKRNVLI